MPDLAGWGEVVRAVSFSVSVKFVPRTMAWALDRGCPGC